MINFCESTKESMKDTDKCLDPQLWHACAGSMVQMPAINSRVYYFPQGHAEHALGTVDFGSSARIPPLILCRVNSIKYMADPETDEVFTKIRLTPFRTNEPDYADDDATLSLGNNNDQEKPASFAKTLTQSDANNGGGFSVPRYCAETIFPRLDYSADPPVQTVLAKDVHGDSWKFRHIYRGTPRRHLLTTGWSTFVNQKKLVAGDSIVFLRTENGDLCVGIRRAKRGIGGGPDHPGGWNPNPNGGNGLSGYGGFSPYFREEESRIFRGNANGNGTTNGMNNRGKVRAEAVVEAAKLAGNGQSFEVVYYPRASTPEFCVKAASVRAAMRIQWCSGMRFKMAFETEDSSRISWFMGTISSVQVADPIRWPHSPWRLLLVTWDEPDLLQNVKRVSPWLVELVSNMPAIHLSPFSPPRKKPRVLQHEFPMDGQIPTPVFSGNPLGQVPTPAAVGIQGARHAQLGLSFSDLHLNKLQQSGLFHHTGFHHVAAPSRISTSLIIGNGVHAYPENISCLLTIGTTPPQNEGKKSLDTKSRQLVLFGQPILTEEQISQSSSGNSLSDGKSEKTAENSYCEIGLETGHCKVFMETEDIGRTLDLSVLGSYEELYARLEEMFGIDKSEMTKHVLYRDATGAVRHTGDEPFSEFTKTAKRLTILMDSITENVEGS